MSAIATLALAYLHNLIVVGIALLAGGFVWLATMHPAMNVSVIERGCARLSCQG